MGQADNPYVSEGVRRSWQEVGVTCAMILAFSRRICISAHDLWGENKVLSYTPEAPATGLYLHIHGDHVFFVSDQQTKATIARMRTTKPALRPDVVPKVISKSDAPQLQSGTCGTPMPPQSFPATLLSTTS